MSKFNPALLIMQPRRIPECILAIGSLQIDKFWLGYMWERDLVPVIASIVEHAPYTHYLLLADDTTPTQQALDLVLEHMPNHPVVTGYCNLDLTVEGSQKVNLTDRPFTRLDDSYASDYSWITRVEVERHVGEMIPTFFAGACLTGMSREMWQRYPFGVVTRPDEDRGYASDWSLSTRLHKDGVPIVAPYGAFVLHVKEKLGKGDTDIRKRLLIGSQQPDVRWQKRGAEKDTLVTFFDDEGGIPVLNADVFAKVIA